MTPIRGALILAAVLAVLTGLYRYADIEATGAARFASALTALRLHDAELNRDLLRLHAGDLLHYDSVNAAVEAIEKDLRSLSDHAGPLRPQVAALARLARHKAILLERFKSAHALVRNSLAYFLHLQETLSADHPAVPSLGAAMLRFVRRPAQKNRRTLEELLARLPAREPFTPLRNHTRLLLRLLPKQQRLLGELLNTPLGATATRLAVVHEAALARLQRRADGFRLALYMAAAVFFVQLTLALIRLQRANRRLRQEMRQRLEAERQLLQAQKMEALGSFASGIAHDFNNLLAGVRGYLVLAREQLAAGERPEGALERIDTIVGRGQEMIQRLLQFARPRSDRSVQFDPSQVVEEALGFVRPTLPKAVSLRFANRLPEDRRVRGRPGEWQQVVVNLVRNAADAVGNQGHIEVLLDEAENGVRLRVRDDGGGIEPERLATLFDPFASGKPVGLGTGLGLTIVRRIVEGHGGRIEVDSQPGQGTCFTVNFPGTPLQR
ncbi:two-component system, cell cycle sensor histidine kinase and response regulator CckA [Methylomarinovum caldicuralii]|uniref:histidine kinase n=1 Tax=Methylomarinovum caldicuralii TaxID=438856 RepID=A0AAU9BZI1_9GAMM|nr:DAHL domain-containing protein [Methylomarinovum caldicuralii]BCX81775.1 two-component system, cell cycle sensor histidine kinase and response regulator CckA [Methylomarinovum caldicuralii]